MTDVFVECRKGNLDFVRNYFSNTNHNVNDRDRMGITILHEAIQCHQRDIVAYLLTLPTINVNVFEDDEDNT